MINIETDRLIFREINDDDFDNLKNILSNPIIMKYYPKPYDDEGVLKWIKWSKACYEKRGFGLWALELKDIGEFIGDCGITLQNINGKEVFEIGYHLHSDYWHKGLATEAAKACKKWFFENTDYDEVYSYMNADNIGSYSVAIRNGMKLYEEYINEGVPHKVYRITRQEYLNQIQDRAQ